MSTTVPGCWLNGGCAGIESAHFFPPETDRISLQHTADEIPLCLLQSTDKQNGDWCESGRTVFAISELLTGRNLSLK